MFPGGNDVVMGWLANNIEYPKEAFEKGIQGRVVASFAIQKDGTVSDIKIISSPHTLLSAAAVEVLLKMPKWKPAKKMEYQLSLYLLFL